MKTSILIGDGLVTAYWESTRNHTTADLLVEVLAFCHEHMLTVFDQADILGSLYTAMNYKGDREIIDAGRERVRNDLRTWVRVGRKQPLNKQAYLSRILKLILNTEVHFVPNDPFTKFSARYDVINTEA